MTTPMTEQLRTQRFLEDAEQHGIRGQRLSAEALEHLRDIADSDGYERMVLVADLSTEQARGWPLPASQSTRRNVVLSIDQIVMIATSHDQRHERCLRRVRRTLGRGTPPRLQRLPRTAQEQP